MPARLGRRWPPGPRRSSGASSRPGGQRARRPITPGHCSGLWTSSSPGWSPGLLGKSITNLGDVTEMYPLTVAEAGRLKPRCHHGHAFSPGAENPSLPPPSSWRRRNLSFLGLEPRGSRLGLRLRLALSPLCVCASVRLQIAFVEGTSPWSWGPAASGVTSSQLDDIC